jgi:hypothetical protein
MERAGTVETTVGELVVALTDEASRYVRDEQAVCKVVAFMVTHLLVHSGAASRKWGYWQ